MRQPQIPQIGGLPAMGNPMQYRMPQMGGNMNMGGSADYFSRGQAMLANASQSLGQMDKAKNQTTTTITEEPPMSAFDMLGAGVGYGLAGMQAYDLYQSWGKDKGNPYLQNQPTGMDPERANVLSAFGNTQPATTSPGLSAGSDMLGNYGAGNQYLQTSGPQAPPSPPQVPTQGASMMGKVGGGLGMVGGAQNMYAGVQSGNPLQAGMGGLQAYQGYSALSGGAGAGSGTMGAVASKAGPIGAAIGAQLMATDTNPRLIDGKPVGDIRHGHYLTEPWLDNLGARLGWGPTPGAAYHAGDKKSLFAATDYWTDPARGVATYAVSNIFGSTAGKLMNPVSFLLG